MSGGYTKLADPQVGPLTPIGVVINPLVVSSGGLLTYRIDEGATYSYYGFALPGTDNADNNWRIMRETVANPKEFLWADGDTSFDNNWELRASLVYL